MHDHAVHLLVGITSANEWWPPITLSGSQSGCLKVSAINA